MTMTPAEGQITDQLARGEAVFGAPGACNNCGHGKIWHNPRNRVHECEKCSCAGYVAPLAADLRASLTPGNHWTTSPAYGAPAPDLRAGIPADVLEQLETEADFLAAAENLSVAAEQLCDQREGELAEAQANLERARNSAEIAKRAEDTASARVTAILKRHGLVRRADGFALAEEPVTGPASVEIDPA